MTSNDGTGVRHLPPPRRFLPKKEGKPLEITPRLKQLVPKQGVGPRQPKAH